MAHDAHAHQAPLDERGRALLDFERNWPLVGEGSKEDALRAAFGITKARYYQLLKRLVDSEAAYAYDPLTVKRLRRRAQAQVRRRTAAALGERRGT